MHAENDLRTGVIYLEALCCVYTDSVGLVAVMEAPMPLVCVSPIVWSQSVKLIIPNWQMSPTILKLLKMCHENASS